MWKKILWPQIKNVSDLNLKSANLYRVLLSEVVGESSHNSTQSSSGK